MNVVNVTHANLKILLVDDEPANIMLSTKMLSVKGFNNIMSTLSSREAISLFQEHCFDLVLLDINMPEMNGYEVIEKLRQSDGFDKTEVVAISGNVYPADINKGLDAGFSDYLTKPTRIDTLFDAVDKAIQRMSG